MKKLEWNVFIEQYNEFKPYNIFSHGGFMTEVKKAYKQYSDNKKEFANQIQSELRYFFWSKCEWEIIVSAWPTSSKIKPVKIDVYTQVMWNWDNFIDYTWQKLGGN